ncbi:M56 family metallopeptidase [Halopiger aswanensis]|uniref:BlaR1 peptidase M56 n=1 Tax=Halopiger aswanensis TaxID=148449 RepID=A0A3R7GSQ1_9EURY|nr:M56 family metallopeptidase [Halopiger aswanensis]RKD86241.1 BlaR1 peptidase M56 [Halopiger aswanensis]
MSTARGGSDSPDTDRSGERRSTIGAFFRATYDCDALPRAVVRELTQRAGHNPVGQDGERRWRIDHSFGLYQIHVTYDLSAGTVTVLRRIHLLVRFAIALLVAAVGFGIVLEWRIGLNGGLLGGVILALLLSDLATVPSLESATLRSFGLAPGYYLVLGAMLAAAAASPDVQWWFTGGLGVVIGLLLAVQYARGASFPLLSFPTPDRAPAQLRIVLVGFAVPITVILLLTPVTALWALVPGTLAFVLSIGGCAYATVLLGFACRLQIKDLERSEFAVFPSDAERYLFLLTYLALNLLLVRELLWGVNLVSAAVLDVAVLDGYELAGAATDLVDIVRRQIGVAVTIGGRTIDPVSGIAVAAPFAPLIAVVGCWCVFVGHAISSRLRTGAAREFVWTAPDGTAVPVRVVEDDQPYAGVKGRVFGFQPYVVVSSPIVDTFDEAERDAVLAHELYHLRNRDPVVNAVATATALFLFGGRNAFLVFYEYPRIEREADSFAVELTSARAVRDALERIWDWQARSTIAGRRQGTGPHPAATAASNGKRRTRWIERLPGGTRLHTWISDAGRDLGAFYRLFYGDVLLGNAHPALSERIEQLRHEEAAGPVDSE